jgi:hypothetical protein
MKYALSVEVKLLELPEEPEPFPAPRPGDDPMTSVLGPALKVMTGAVARGPIAFMGQSAGFDFRKSITVAVPNFQGLANILNKFDALACEIELDAMRMDEHP